MLAKHLGELCVNKRVEYQFVYWWHTVWLYWRLIYIINLTDSGHQSCLMVLSKLLNNHILLLLLLCDIGIRQSLIFVPVFFLFFLIFFCILLLVSCLFYMANINLSTKALKRYCDFVKSTWLSMFYDILMMCMFCCFCDVYCFLVHVCIDWHVSWILDMKTDVI